MCSRSRRRLTYCSSDSPRAPGRAPDSASAAWTITASTVCGSTPLWGGSLPAGPAPRRRVGGLDDHGLDGLRLDLVVVGLHRVRDGLGLAVPAREVAAHQ